MMEGAGVIIGDVGSHYQWWTDAMARLSMVMNGGEAVQGLWSLTPLAIAICSFVGIL